MQRLSAPLALALTLALAAPATAQDAPEAPRNPELSEGFSLLEEGARLMLRGLVEELAPALRELEDGFRQLQELVGDMALYHAPEVLPNGDILIRRRTPLDRVVPDLPSEPGAEIEL